MGNSSATSKENKGAALGTELGGREVWGIFPRWKLKAFYGLMRRLIRKGGRGKGTPE